jgi:D-proline reductase (dithiol) PrdB
VPVLARTIEKGGLPTVTVTMMPAYAQTAGTPRILGVEFPFGHPMGMPGDVETQTGVLLAALRHLDQATEPRARRDLDYQWPVPQEIAYKAWQPREPSPIVAWFKEQVLKRRAEEGEG